MREKVQIATIAVLLVLAACQPGAAAPTIAEPPAAAPPQPSLPPPDGRTAAASAPAASQPTSVPTAAAVRQALEATDPTTVALGAGRPALVEFFAFW